MGTETKPRAAAPARGGRRGGAGQLAVGDYTGQPAGDAAQAVRRAGLRPGLERSFGCDASLVGLVVGQEPPAGSALARNGMVTLQVAAPGASPAIEEAPAARPEPETTSETVSSTARRRRKSGRAHRAPQSFDVAPPPVLPRPGSGEPTEASRPATFEADATSEAAEIDISERPSEERLLDALTDEEFVVHVDDVFAHRTHLPRRTRLRLLDVSGISDRLRALLARHRKPAAVVALAASVVVLLPVLVGTGQHPVAGRHDKPAEAHASAHVFRDKKVAGRGATPHASRPRRPAHRGYRARTARVARTSPRPVASATPAQAPAPAAGAGAPADEQTQGGPFSP